jgi:hypothetical protein
MFGILIPWEYKDEYRTFTQRAFGRSFISLFRISLELLSIIIPILWVKYKIVTLETLFRIIAYVVIFTLFVAIIDVFVGYKIRGLIPNARLIQGRFMALNGEPRVMGSVMLFANILFYYLKKKFGSKLFAIVYYLTFVGILLSGSASAILSLFAVVFVINIILSKTNRILFVPIGVFIVLILNVGNVLQEIVSNDFISEKTLYKIEYVLGTNESILIDNVGSNDEPELFQRFEVFDRAALNFLWNNPLYFVIGTGPNLVSIPASAYIDDNAKRTYDQVINSVPHTYLINIVSRSGLFGIITIVIMFFFRFKKQLELYTSKDLTIMFHKIFAVNLILNSSLFYFLLGIVILTFLITRYANNSNSNAEFS